MTEATIGPNDVLLGRGGATNNHVGNRTFRGIVADHQKEYLAARKKDKIVIARKIVSIVQQSGGRFLKRDSNDTWVEATTKRAQEKTSQALREGLDVRNSSLRPNKRPRRDSESSGSQSSLKKTGKVVYGRVAVVSPSMQGVSLPQYGQIPELRDETSYPGFLNYHPYPVNERELEHTCEV